MAEGEFPSASDPGLMPERGAKNQAAAKSMVSFVHLPGDDIEGGNRGVAALRRSSTITQSKRDLVLSDNMSPQQKLDKMKRVYDKDGDGKFDENEVDNIFTFEIQSSEHLKQKNLTNDRKHSLVEIVGMGIVTRSVVVFVLAAVLALAAACIALLASTPDGRGPPPPASSSLRRELLDVAGLDDPKSVVHKSEEKVQGAIVESAFAETQIDDAGVSMPLMQGGLDSNIDISIMKLNSTTEILSPSPSPPPPCGGDCQGECCGLGNLLYLEAPAADSGAGLGHSFMQFNHLVTFSLENNVSIRTTYQTRGHGLNPSNVSNYFFGDQTMTPLPKNTTCTRKRSTIQSLPSDALHAKKESSCAVFIMEVFPPSPRGIEINLPYYRRLFGGNEFARQFTIKRKWEQPNRSKRVHVAVHIRRGDLILYLKQRSEATEGRLVHENMYTTVLNQLLIKLKELGKFDVDVRLYCEGMKPPASIQGASDWSLVDLSKGIIFDAKQNVTILPADDDDTLQGWDDMCFSDVLITGTSGFSYLASILCNTPVILGVPFWHSYDYIPNAMTLDVEREAKPVPAVGLRSANLIYRASFNETRFELLWRERFPMSKIEENGN